MGSPIPLNPGAGGWDFTFLLEFLVGEVIGRQTEMPQKIGPLLVQNLYQRRVNNDEVKVN